MEKRDYFCIVKHHIESVKVILTIIIVLLICSITPVCAQNNSISTDSVEVSLLTCSPHDEIYSLYGHTALRYRDKKTGEDWAFNYGVFNFNKPFFILRFAFGKTDYELGVIPFELFLQEYRRFNSQVTEQVLNMTNEEKQKIYEALKVNYLPENRIYRYNFFYDNCTTRARNMVENCIKGKIKYSPKDNMPSATYRSMIHEKTKNNPWAEFANDICLGIKADKRIDIREQQFLPENLMLDFEHAHIYMNNGSRPLVKESRIVVESGIQTARKDVYLSPMQCAYILLIVSLIILYVEIKKKKISVTWDVFLMLINGLSGIALIVLFLSEHPTTSTNLQMLLINPLPLFFLPSIIHGRIVFWRIYIVLIILFLIGSVFQDYAKGMEIVALCLLLRCYVHLRQAYNKQPFKRRILR